MYKILMIDDNEIFLESLDMYLSNIGYEIETTTSAVEALLRCTDEYWDLVLSDLYTKDMDSAKFLRLVNKVNKDLKLAIFYREEDEGMELDALSSTGIDFIAKSDDPEVLLMRIKQVLDKNNTENSKIISRRENLVIDKDCRVVTVNNKVVQLSETEFYILKALLENKDKVLSREFIYDEIRGDRTRRLENIRVIDVHVLKLRRKLGVYSIVAEKGLGYIWKESL